MIEPMTPAEIAEVERRESSTPLSDQPNLTTETVCGTCGEPITQDAFGELKHAYDFEYNHYATPAPVPREETVCEWCGGTRWGHHTALDGRCIGRNGKMLARKFTPPVPDTPGAIPSGLKAIHRACKLENRSLAGPFAAELIERIGVLETALRAVDKWMTERHMYEAKQLLGVDAATQGKQGQ